MRYNPYHILISLFCSWGLSWQLLLKHLFWNLLGSPASLKGLYSCLILQRFLERIPDPHLAQCLVIYYVLRLPALGITFVVKQMPNKYSSNWTEIWWALSSLTPTPSVGVPDPIQLRLHCQAEYHPTQDSSMAPNPHITVYLQVTH